MDTACHQVETHRSSLVQISLIIGGFNDSKVERWQRCHEQRSLCFQSANEISIFSIDKTWQYVACKQRLFKMLLTWTNRLLRKIGSSAVIEGTRENNMNDASLKSYIKSYCQNRMVGKAQACKERRRTDAEGTVWSIVLKGNGCLFPIYSTESSVWGNCPCMSSLFLQKNRQIESRSLQWQYRLELFNKVKKDPPCCMGGRTDQCLGHQLEIEV